VSDTVWSIVVVAALFGWVFSVILFIFRVFTGIGQCNLKAARLWGGAVLVFFGIWIAGLLNA